MAIISQCAPRARCRQWKKCDACAHIRQSQIADVAELGAMQSRHVTYAVIKTSSPQSIKADKTKLIRAMKDKIDGGIWTIEEGAVSVGLHINLIAGADTPIRASELAKNWASEGEVWAAEIPVSDVRNVAAYSSKRSTMPDKQVFSGQLYGSFGGWRSALGHVTGLKMQALRPELWGAGIEQQMKQAGIEPPPEPLPVPPLSELPPMSKKQTRKETAARISRNAATRATYQHEKTEALKRNYLRRLFAVHEGVISLDGYAYIDGYGMVTVDDMAALGFNVDGNADRAREDWRDISPK